MLLKGSEVILDTFTNLLCSSRTKLRYKPFEWIARCLSVEEPLGVATPRTAFLFPLIISQPAGLATLC